MILPGAGDSAAEHARSVLRLGVALGAHGRALSRRLIATICFVALAIDAVSVVNMAWVTPTRTNHSARKSLAESFSKASVVRSPS